MDFSLLLQNLMKQTTDQRQYFVTSDLDLHWLQRSVCPNTQGKYAYNLNLEGKADVQEKELNTD